MDLLSIAILLQLWCVYFCCPVNRAQVRAEFMGLVWAERETHKGIKNRNFKKKQRRSKKNVLRK